MLLCLLLYNFEPTINFRTKEIRSIVSLQSLLLFYKFYYSNVYFTCTVVRQTFIHAHTFGVHILCTVYSVCRRKMKIHAGLHNQMANNIHMYMNQNWIENVIAVVLAATVAGLKVKIYYVSFSFYLNKC